MILWPPLFLVLGGAWPPALPPPKYAPEKPTFYSILPNKFFNLANPRGQAPPLALPPPLLTHMAGKRELVTSPPGSAELEIF